MSLLAHLQSGASHVCRAWAVTRRDGVKMGFTDHDQDLTFDGIRFRADSGLSAMAVQQTTGLAVDNTEAIGALSAEVIREEDIAAGRFDDAEVMAWLVRWDDVSQRVVQFRGTIGALTRQGVSFTAELRGLTEALNVPGGRVFHRLCPAVLGDSACGVNTSAGVFAATGTVVGATDAGEITLSGLGSFAATWFEGGAAEVLSGAAKGLRGTIKSDRIEGGGRQITLNGPLGGPLAAGDQLRLIAGCDKRFETCRAKFSNGASFQGFPHIPGEDWLMSVPQRGGANDGGSMNS